MTMNQTRRARLANVALTRRASETDAAFLKRFKRAWERSGLPKDMRRKEFAMSPGEQKREAARRAIRRSRKNKGKG
jgi:ribosomal protein S21